MTTEDAQPSTESTELRRQEMEFYEALLVVLAAMPAGKPRHTPDWSRRSDRW